MGIERKERRPGPQGAMPARSAPVPDGTQALAALVGNRAIASMLQRTPAAAAPEALQVIPMKTWEPSRDEVQAAEEWVMYYAHRGRTGKPRRMPERYKDSLEKYRRAVAGARDQGKDKPVADARWFLKSLRQLHDQLLGVDTGKELYRLAGLALDRADANAAKDSLYDPEGASELEWAQVMQVISTQAGDELREAQEMGYSAPAKLSGISAEVRKRWDAAAKHWEHGAPGHKRLITPAEEAELERFRVEAMGEVHSMRARRAADMARYHRSQAEAVEAAAQQHLLDLRKTIADRRRALFMAGKTGDLKKLHEASGKVVGVINEMEDAAKIITERVDTLNKVVETVGKAGKAPISLPSLPKGITGVADKLKDAHGKLGKVLELLGVLGPAKTKIDEGLQFLKGIDMALEGFNTKGNPMLDVYVNSYLRPGIQNCIAHLSKIAGIISDHNREAIGAGHPELVWNWATEPGGENAYLFLRQVFKVRGAAAPNAAAWSYLLAHADDLSAAVGDPMPRDQRRVGPWASRNRLALWEAFYGSTQPPR